MMRSLFAGVSALRNHQVKMDVIGNNIANVNTIGYKASTVSFKEQLSQTLKGAGAPQGGRGGTNPQQIGLGVDLAAITNVHTPGNLQLTGVESDVAIEGNGFFVLSAGNEQFFTRAGAFDFDEEGALVSLANGMHVMGYAARSGEVDVGGGLVPLRIPLNQTIPPVQTTKTTVIGNLDARLNGSITLENNPVRLPTAPPVQATIVVTEAGFNEWTWEVHAPGVTVQGDGTITIDSNGDLVVNGDITIDDGQGNTFTLQGDVVGSEPVFAWSHGEQVTIAAAVPTAEDTSVRVFDSRGEQHDVMLAFEKHGENEWSWRATDVDGNDLGSGGTLTFNTAGALIAQTGTIIIHPSGAEPMEIEPDFQSITQFAEASDITKTRQDGFPAGNLTTISVDSAGRINGSFSNGLSQTLAQIAIADFANPAGLLKAAGTMFQVSPNSGEPDIGLAGTGARGTVSPGALEASNVDLSLEFTNMIITQRGFQANSRVITTSDEMLQELVNLKR